MRLHSVITLLAVGIVATVTAEDNLNYISSMTELDSIKQSGHAAYVAWVRPDCGYCTQLKNNLKEMDEKEDYVFYLVDVTAADKDLVDLKKQLGDSNGVPDIYLFNVLKNPVHYPDHEERTPERFGEFINTVMSLKIEKLENVEDLEAFRKSTKPVVYVVCDKNNEELAHDVLEEIQKFYMEAVYAYIVNPKNLSAELLNTLRAHQAESKSPEQSISLEKAKEMVEKQTIVPWVKMATQPPLLSFPDDAKVIFDLGIDQVLFILNTAEGTEANRDWLTVFGEDVRGKAVVCTVDTEADGAENVIEFFGVTEQEQENLPVVRIFDHTKRKQYKLDTDKQITAKSLYNWVVDVKSGAAAPSMKSQDPIEGYMDKPVKELVGKNIHEVAMDKTKTVLVKFYAPWCGHCKRIAPIWEELAEELKDHDDIVIAKFDATLNDVDEEAFGHVSGFPTIRLFKKDNTYLTYNGERDLDSLRQYVLKHNGPALVSEEAHDEL